jgi:hypothetical protein
MSSSDRISCGCLVEMAPVRFRQSGPAVDRLSVVDQLWGGRMTLSMT